jgi:hypothetical protein
MLSMALCLLIRVNVDLEEIKFLLGQNSIQTTKRN